MRPCVLDCVLGALLVCHHARSGLAFMISRRSHLAGGTPDTDYLFMTHHKTGTELAGHFADDMSQILGIPQTIIPWVAVWDASNSLSGSPLAEAATQNIWELGMYGMELYKVTWIGCTGEIFKYEDMRVPLLNQTLKTCPGTRAVHLVRQPSEVVVSNYAYTKDLLPFEERPGDVLHGEILRTHSLAWGVNNMCEHYFERYNDQMLEVHQMIQDKKLDNILEVRLEDFDADFDSTTRSIFEHLLGSDHPSIDKLVEAASKHDVNRMNQTLVDNNHHISADSDKASVKMEMTRLFEKGNSCMKKLPEVDTLMGYTEPFFVSPE